MATTVGVKRKLPEDAGGDGGTPKKNHRFVCVLCKYSTNRKDNYTKHLRTHTKEKPFSCSICNKAFSDMSNMLNHKKQVHEGTRRYQCTVCSQSFKRPGHLKQHMSRHSDVKPFRCEHAGCTKAYKTKAALSDHVKRVHEMKRDYRCMVCGDAFYASYQLTSHYAKHKKDLEKVEELKKELAEYKKQVKELSKTTKSPSRKSKRTESILTKRAPSSQSTAVVL